MEYVLTDLATKDILVRFNSYSLDRLRRHVVNTNTKHAHSARIDRFPLMRASGAGFKGAAPCEQADRMQCMVLIFE